MRLTGIGPGGGTPNEQKVLTGGEALTFAISESEAEHVSEHDGLLFNWSSGTVDVAAGGTVLLVKNTSSLNLHVEFVDIDNGSLASEYTVHLPTTEVTVTGTAVTGTGLNSQRPEPAEASAASNETNNAQGNVIRTLFMSADTNRDVNTAGVILAKNKSIAVDVVENTSESAVTIIGFYKAQA